MRKIVSVVLVSLVVGLASVAALTEEAKKAPATAGEAYMAYRAAFAKAKAGGAVARADGNGDLTDGIVMLRPRIALGKHWAFSPTLSVGGGDSDLVWEAAPEFVYTNDCCNLEFRFGYRTVNYEYEENNVELDFSIAGPMVGVGFAF